VQTTAIVYPVVLFRNWHVLGPFPEKQSERERASEMKFQLTLTIEGHPVVLGFRV
jgi:hypothetical protein